MLSLILPAPVTVDNQSNPSFERVPIIDIRSTSYSTTGVSLEDGIRASIVSGLSHTYNEKVLPALLLYNEEGLRLFEQITYQPDYYLTKLEIDILSKYATEIANAIPDGALLLELGAGALRKTALVLDAIEAQKKKITYFALDLDKPELIRTLGKLYGRYTYVDLAGLWGTYDDGCVWLKQFNDCHRVVLWLGSSVGNMTRKEAGQFIRTFGDIFSPRDRFIIAIDTRSHNPDDVRTAYNDRAGVTRRFALNALISINDIFNAEVIDISCFAYSPYYNEIQGRNEAYFRCIKQTKVCIPSKEPVVVHEKEYIRFAYSHKYDCIERQLLWSGANARVEREWTTEKEEYTVTMLSWA